MFVGAYFIREYDPTEVPLPPPTRFQRIVGIVPEDDIYADASGDGYVRHNANYVYLWRAPWTTDTELEYYLVHELTHLAQHEVNASDRIGRGLLGANEEFVTDATLEGAAVFVGTRYAEEYGLTYDPYEALVEEYDGAGPLRRVDSPRNLTTVYDDPPRCGVRTDCSLSIGRTRRGTRGCSAGTTRTRPTRSRLPESPSLFGTLPRRRGRRAIR